MRRALVPLLVMASMGLAQDRPAAPPWSKIGDFQFHFEFRTRMESRTGVTFGRDADLQNPLFRTRLGVDWTPKKWLKVSAAGQDARAPLYGVAPPTSARDGFDLHESYLELFPEGKGFGFLGGRQMVSLGEGRLIGVPQWVNTARSYDTARVRYRMPWLRIEFLTVSQVRVRSDDFNKPVLGDRVWGTYNQLPKAIRGGMAEVYYLRHDQNATAGFAGPGRLGINTYGGRATGPLPHKLRYSLEGVLQNGHLGTRPHRAGGWFSGISGKADGWRPFEYSAEYKYASGSGPPGVQRDSTFDQLYAANHDKFGHADLFGWRNVHSIRSLETIRLTGSLALNFMFDSTWLASPWDALYNGQGRSLARSATGRDGRHVGEEIDIFGVWAHRGFQFGAGFAKLIAGEFLHHTTPGIGTRYVYLFTSYGF